MTQPLRLPPEPAPGLAAVVFDFDGTMVDTESAVYAAIAEVWAEHGLELTAERWAPHVGKADSFDWLGELEARAGPLDRAVVQADTMQRVLRLAGAEPLLPGVAELLDACAEAGVAVAVASNAPKVWLQAQLGSRGLLDRFGAICAVDEVARPKPAPDVYLAALERLGVPASAAVAIEDSPTGVAAARAAGLACVAVPGGLSAHMDVSAATRVVPSLVGVTPAVLAEVLAGRHP